MCGICGEWMIERDSAGATMERLKRMTSVLSHRGPDGQGMYVYGREGRSLGSAQLEADSHKDVGRGRVGLGHRRLSIIDLTTGSQPMPNEDLSVWIVFNGEIYNYAELRERLEASGHRFSTRSDTEVIVHLYEDHGAGCVRLLNGMFAFGVWDERRERLFLARDRFGIKPLFYSWDGRRLVFGSEIKAVLESVGRKEIDMEALHDYLSLNYIPGPRTIYRGIKKLQPGHILEAGPSGISVERYWEVPSGGASRAAGEDDAAEELLLRLRKAVRAQMVSDVPLGVFLSGGLDSSTIVALMSEVSGRPVRTFSIGFDEESYDETPMARLVASRFSTEHTELIVRPDVRDLLPSLVKGFDEPFADSSAIPTYCVSRLARSSVTVALGGDGGDEVFAGYETYAAGKLARAYSMLPGLLKSRLVAPIVGMLPASDKKVSFDYKAKRFVAGAGLGAEKAHFWWKTIFSEDAKSMLYAQGFGHPWRDSFQVFSRHFGERKGGDLIDRLQYVDIKVYLPDDILVKVDRMSMANSLEVRVPFLDHEVVEFAVSLPSRLRLKGLKKKYILRKAVKGILPSEVMRGKKRGFNVPIARWLREELKELVGDYLSPGALRLQGYFNPGYVAEMIRRHERKECDYSRNIWSLLMFGMWLEKDGLG